MALIKELSYLLIEDSNTEKTNKLIGSSFMADKLEQKVATAIQTQRKNGKTSGNGKDRDKHDVITTNDNIGCRTEEEIAVYSDFGNGSHNQNNFAGDVVNNSGYAVGDGNGSIIYGGTANQGAEVGSGNGNGVHSWRNFGNGNYNGNNFGGRVVNNSGYAVGKSNGSIIHGNFGATSKKS